MEMVEVVMNPVRQRIFQYLLIHEKGTVKEIKKELQDIPSASLYRHVKVLADHSLIIVVEENRIRGTVENVYQINKKAFESGDQDGTAVQMALLSICAKFAKYFSGAHVDPKKDMLLLTNCTLTLDDDEFMRYLSEINEITMKYMKKKSSEKSKIRQITLISAPTNE
ncbi:MAG: helix-turn-helix domain-containing protein [Clostridia bacterium]|nr:helix-turn-helix domain-containing protein [Clostridia bacterium]